MKLKKILEYEKDAFDLLLNSIIQLPPEDEKVRQVDNAITDYLVIRELLLKYKCKKQTKKK